MNSDLCAERAAKAACEMMMLAPSVRLARDADAAVAAGARWLGIYAALAARCGGQGGYVAWGAAFSAYGALLSSEAFGGSVAKAEFSARLKLAAKEGSEFLSDGRARAAMIDGISGMFAMTASGKKMEKRDCLSESARWRDESSNLLKRVHDAQGARKRSANAAEGPRFDSMAKQLSSAEKNRLSKAAAEMATRRAAGEKPATRVVAADSGARWVVMSTSSSALDTNWIARLVPEDIPDESKPFAERLDTAAWKFSHDIGALLESQNAAGAAQGSKGAELWSDGLGKLSESASHWESLAKQAGPLDNVDERRRWLAKGLEMVKWLGEESGFAERLSAASWVFELYGVDGLSRESEVSVAESLRLVSASARECASAGSLPGNAAEKEVLEVAEVIDLNMALAMSLEERAELMQAVCDAGCRRSMARL